VVKNCDIGMSRTGTPFSFITDPSSQHATTWKGSAPCSFRLKHTQAFSVTQTTSPPLNCAAVGKQMYFPPHKTLLFVLKFCVTMISLIRVTDIPSTSYFPGSGYYLYILKHYLSILPVHTSTSLFLLPFSHASL